MVGFAAFSLAAIDRVLKSTLDARLTTTVRAFAATAAGHVRNRTVDRVIVRELTQGLGIAQSDAIVARDGTIALTSGAVPASIVQVAMTSSVTGTTYATIPDNGGLRVAALRVTGGEGSTLVVWRPLDVIEDYERAAVVTFVGASLAIVALAFVAGSLIVGRGLRPLRAMAARASEIEAHDLSRRLSDASWDDELANFAGTFDRMLDRLQAAFVRQRQFTADASHDLRAPLAVIRAEVDLALARARAAAPDEASFASINEEVLEFDRLLDALLLSARADAGPIAVREVDLVDLARRAARKLESFATSRGVRVENTVTGDFTIAGDDQILERVFVSLLHNGIKFSPEGGVVTMGVREHDDAVSTFVRDQGAGFSDEALEFACDRFWKADTARGRGGSGLGLAIAKSAVERAGGSIAIRNVPGGGAEVETTFPRAT